MFRSDSRMSRLTATTVLTGPDAATVGKVTSAEFSTPPIVPVGRLPFQP